MGAGTRPRLRLGPGHGGGWIHFRDTLAGQQQSPLFTWAACATGPGTSPPSTALRTTAARRGWGPTILLAWDARGRSPPPVSPSEKGSTSGSSLCSEASSESTRTERCSWFPLWGPPKHPSRAVLLLSLATRETLFGTRRFHFGLYKETNINSNYAIY